MDNLKEVMKKSSLDFYKMISDMHDIGLDFLGDDLYLRQLMELRFIRSIIDGLINQISESKNKTVENFELFAIMPSLEYCFNELKNTNLQLVTKKKE